MRHISSRSINSEASTSELVNLEEICPIATTYTVKLSTDLNIQAYTSVIPVVKGFNTSLCI